MEDFKKKLQIRMTLLAIGLICIASAYLLSYPTWFAGNSPTECFQAGAQFGAGIALILVMVYYLVKTRTALNNSEQLKLLYISETDERKLFIMQKSGSVGINVVKFGLALGAIIAGNFNDTVFFTLLGACFFVLVVHKFLKLYYLKKY